MFRAMFMGQEFFLLFIIIVDDVLKQLDSTAVTFLLNNIQCKKFLSYSYIFFFIATVKKDLWFFVF